MTSRNAVIGIVALIIIAAGALYFIQGSTPQPQVQMQQTDEQIVRSVVSAFGSSLKNVSLLAPDASAEITAQYSPYVAPELLAQWTASTTQAPGRYTSSPWPDRIEISSMTPGPTGQYTVEGTVVEITSADQAGQPAALYDVTLQLQNRGGTWLITSYNQSSAELPKS